jgi:hypothetical protein
MNNNKRGREDDKGLAPYLGVPFDELPPTALYKVVAESGLTIAQMHRLCALSKRFARICKQTQIWKTTFITKFVRQPGDKRNPARFEQWVNEPRVQLWDTNVAMDPNMRGFTHLVAESIATRADDLLHVYHWLTFSENRMVVDVKFTSKGIPDDEHDDMAIFFNRYQPTEAAFRAYLGVIASHCGLTMKVGGHADWADTELMVSSEMTKAERICLIVYLLEHRWVEGMYEDEERKTLIERQCVLCAAPATMKCPSCDKVYCGQECLSVGERN